MGRDCRLALRRSGLLPIIDCAYQGLGHGMDEDAYGMRTVLAAVPEALIAYSCDKNFGMYRDRVGAFYILGSDQAVLDRHFRTANALARAAWSMPPDHGGAAVRMILRDPELTSAWLDELDDDAHADAAGARAAGQGGQRGPDRSHPARHAATGCSPCCR